VTSASRRIRYRGGSQLNELWKGRPINFDIECGRGSRPYIGYIAKPISRGLVLQKSDPVVSKTALTKAV
jgi:hypothetical protein